jgi:hypothetical protein
LTQISLRETNYAAAMILFPRTLAILATAVLVIPTAANSPWDLPPLRYSESTATDRIAKLAEDPQALSELTNRTPLEQLTAVLALLKIPVESQVLVFSKTSAQNPLIHPHNPRGIYFNDHSYVGYVPGGMIEIITQDPVLGAVFYLFTLSRGERPPTIQRDTSSCFSCHGTTRTESAPGMVVRSVHTDADGHLLLALGSSHIDHTSPIEERWGGYYVTGRSSLPHFGNQTFDESRGRDFPRKKVEMDSVAEQIPGMLQRYPRDTSDIVALMVLEHQCRVHNLLNAGALEYRRAHWLARALDPEGDPDTGSAGRVAQSAATRIAEALLFKDEAKLGEDGVEGDLAFQEAFAARYPKSAEGRSLADFQLHSRLFKHQCSFMVYSQAFAALPAGVKSPLIHQLKELLGDGNGAAAWINPLERSKIVRILEDTLPDWNRRNQS